MELDTKAVSPTSRVNLVVEKIKNAIMKGELQPGERLPTESDLVSNLGVGRYSVREAIKMLVALGILEIRRPAGTFVVDQVSAPLVDPLIYRLLLAKKDHHALQELRVCLERSIVELAAAKATPEDLKGLKASFERFRTTISTRNTHQEIIALDCEFHELLARAAHSTLLGTLYETFFKTFIPALERLTKARHIESVLQNHRAIIDVIQRRDTSRESIQTIVANSLQPWSEMV